MPSIADQLRKALADDTRTAQAIADAAKLHRVTIQNFRKGERPMNRLPLDDCERLAVALGGSLVFKPGRNR